MNQLPFNEHQQQRVGVYRKKQNNNNNNYSYYRQRNRSISPNNQQYNNYRQTNRDISPNNQQYNNYRQTNRDISPNNQQYNNYRQTNRDISPNNQQNNNYRQTNRDISPNNQQNNNYRRINRNMFSGNNYRQGNDYRQGNRTNSPKNQQYVNGPQRNIYYNRNYNHNNNLFRRNNNFMNLNNNEYDNRRRFNGQSSRFDRQQQSRNRSGGRRNDYQRGNWPRRTLQLNDFMPLQLRNNSPSLNLPSDFNLNPTTTTATNNALAQNSYFSTQTITRSSSTNNDTQPFETINDDQEQQRPPPPSQKRQTNTTIATTRFKRRQRRNQRQDDIVNQNDIVNHNRFVTLENEESTSNLGGEDNIEDFSSNDYQLNYNEPYEDKNMKKKKKQRIYLQHGRIMKYMQDTVSPITSGRVNQSYILDTMSIYDEWIRNNYSLQVWETYLKLGTENNHWAKEVIKSTKKRDDIINTRFVKKKINQLSSKIAQANAAISYHQIRLSTHWTQSLANTNLSSTSSTSSNKNRLRDSIDRIERYILDYIKFCTQHIRKLSEEKIKLVHIQIEEYKALKEFERIATPAQLNTHLLLKTKMKTLSTKTKNYRSATKRIEYDLPPQFISKNNFTFRIDESIIDKDECQITYNQIRQLIKTFRVQAMEIYLRSTKREFEILTQEIERIILGFPEEAADVDTIGADPGVIAYKKYHDIRDKRIDIEIEQSLYFLEEQYIEGKPPYNDQEQEEIIAPNLIRSLGEDFLLRQ